MNEPQLLLALGPVADLFDELHICWYIGGSVASSIYGVPRTTIDVDIVAELEPEHIGALVTRLADEYYVSEPMIRSAIQRESCFNLIQNAGQGCWSRLPPFQHKSGHRR